MAAQTKEIGRYNTAILKLFEIILNLNVGQQEQLLKLTENLFIKEKRANNRKSCCIPIYYATSDQVYSSQIKNISPTGLFIETEKSLPNGEVIFMVFKLKGIDEPLKIDGEIVHANDDGIGVKFKNLSQEFSYRLERIVTQMQR